jgi:hypothetical protein
LRRPTNIADNYKNLMRLTQLLWKLRLLFSASRVYITSLTVKYWPRWQFTASFKTAIFNKTRVVAFHLQCDKENYNNQKEKSKSAHVLDSLLAIANDGAHCKLTILSIDIWCCQVNQLHYHITTFLSRHFPTMVALMIVEHALESKDTLKLKKSKLIIVTKSFKEDTWTKNSDLHQILKSNKRLL